MDFDRESREHLVNKNENKQHINLSSYAINIMNSDKIAFNCKNTSTFINTIFENFADMAEATIILRLDEKADELNESLKSLDNNIRNKVVSILIEKHKESLIKKTNSYEKGGYFKFRIRESNYKKLTDSNSIYYEKDYYNNIGSYFKAILEEYFRLPYIEREKIYFLEKFEIISKAIEKNYRLNISTVNENNYEIFPYRIQSDKMNMYNYLAGFSLINNATDENKVPCSFRISNIKEITINKRKKRILKKEDKQFIEDLITKREIPFLTSASFFSSTDSPIVVKLNKAGITQYNSNIHLRPHCIKREGSLFFFDCTPLQIEYYFFKFGNKAEIISPKQLANKFKCMYSEALDVYNKN